MKRFQSIFLITIVVFIIIGCNRPIIQAKQNFQKKGETAMESQNNYTIKELYSKRDNLNLYGQAYIPLGKDIYPTVIISHGYNGSYQYSVPYAKSLAEAGIASYIFDFSGGSVNSKSDGSMTDMSVLSEMEDLNEVIDFVKTLPFVDINNLFLLGESQGGMVSALVAPKRINELKGMALIYPAFVIPDDSFKNFPDENSIPERINFMGGTVGKKYFLDARNINIYQDIQGFTKDVLIVHGDNDTLVPISYSEKAVKVYKSAKLTVIKDSGHGFYGEQGKIAEDSITSYIKNAIQN